MSEDAAVYAKLADVFRRIRGEYDPQADRDNYGSSLMDVEKYLAEIEAAFPAIIACDPARRGEVR